MVSLSVIIGAAALFPAYIKAWLADRSAEAQIASARTVKSEAGVDEASQQLKLTSELLATAKDGLGEAQYSDLIRSLIGAKHNVTIISFNLNKPDDKTAEISIHGNAPARDDLLAFKARLESLLPGTSIDIPIEQLARSTNVQFSLQFTQHLK